MWEWLSHKNIWAWVKSRGILKIGWSSEWAQWAPQDSERRQIHWYLKSLHKFDPNILHVTDYQLYIIYIYMCKYIQFNAQIYDMF